MKTSFKNEESGGSINRYITICAIHAIDTISLSKKKQNEQNLVFSKRPGKGMQKEILYTITKIEQYGKADTISWKSEII